MICDLWKEVLHLDRAIGIHDDFFQLGGDSVLATQMLVRLLEKTGFELTLVRFFADPTAAAVAAQLKEAPSQPSWKGRIERRSTTAGAVPSFGQSGMYFLQQFEREKSLLNRPAVFRIRGQLNLDALGRSFNRIVERHEVLRTTYHLADPGLHVRIEPPRVREIPVVDFTTTPAASATAQAMDTGHVEARRPFDLRRLMIRAMVLRLNGRSMSCL